MKAEGGGCCGRNAIAIECGGTRHEVLGREMTMKMRERKRDSDTQRVQKQGRGNARGTGETVRGRVKWGGEGGGMSGIGIR